MKSVSAITDMAMTPPKYPFLFCVMESHNPRGPKTNKEMALSTADVTCVAFTVLKSKSDTLTSATKRAKLAMRRPSITNVKMRSV